MDEGTNWLVGIVLTITITCGLGTYCGVKDNEAMIEMVKSGADPLKASCAIKGSTELNKQICHTL